jgi:hypothetical protein
MDSHIQTVRSLLEKISSCGVKARKFVLKYLSNKEIKLICEVCLNLIRGNIKIKDQRIFAKLKRGRKVLSDLADKRKPLKDKRKILNQKGGFISAIAIAALPLLVGEVSKLIRR